jgi:hypothetical protein
MTCKHVLDLIDAGPFADYPKAHLDAAWQHARQCRTCGPALEVATEFTAGVASLPELSPPPNLSAVVLARIDELDERRSAVTAPSPTRERPTWVTAVAGLTAAFLIVLSTWSTEAARFGIRGITTSAGLPSTTAGTLGLLAGLALYVAALLAPVEGGWKRARER